MHGSPALNEEHFSQLCDEGNVACVVADGLHEHFDAALVGVLQRLEDAAAGRFELIQYRGRGVPVFGSNLVSVAPILGLITGLAVFFILVSCPPGRSRPQAGAGYLPCRGFSKVLMLY